MDVNRSINRRSLIFGGVSAGALVATGLSLDGLLSGRRDFPLNNVARPLPTYGFAGGSDLYFSDATNISRTLDIAVAGVAGGIRFDIPWYYVQNQQATFNWTIVDTIVAQANSRNLFVLGSIVSSPPWAAATNSGSPWVRPRSATEYADFCAAVATRYRGQIDAYEIWNEPNGTLFFSPSVDPVFYTSMVKAAYPKIKAVDPSVTVLAGALAQTGTVGGNMSSNDFLSRMYANGLAGSCDAVSFHPYDWSFSTTFAQQMRTNGSAMRQAIDLHNLMKANGDGAKKLWASEFGVPTVGSVSQTTQNTLLVGSLQQWQEVSFGGPLFIHGLRDRATGSSNMEDVFGVATTAYEPKIALNGLNGLARGGFPKRYEYQVFMQNVDSALGSPVGPAFPQSYGYAQECENGTRYATNHGFISSPTAVAAVARAWNVVPLSPLANGIQDMDVTGGFRVFTRSDLGTHAVYGAILAAWQADMGFPKTDQYQPSGTNGARVEFEFATITWTPGGGTVVTRVAA